MSAARRRSRRRGRRPDGPRQRERLNTIKPETPRSIEWIDKEGEILYESFDAWKRRFPAYPKKQAHEKFRSMIYTLRTESEQFISRWSGFERLEGDREGLCSVRYNKRERIVFCIFTTNDASGGDAAVLEIHEAGGHYDD